MITEAQNRFIIYVRTKQFWQSRLREADAMNPVYISMAEIKERYLSDPSKELPQLVKAGLLDISFRESLKGHRANLYRALLPGGINPSMLKSTGQPLTPLTTYMQNTLQKVSLSTNSPTTLYFDSFLLLRKKYLRLYFTVDSFSGRVHTPITNFHRTHRPNLLIDGKETTSLDVMTMQPLLLGKILKAEIGENDFSNWINSGKDIYLIIQDKANLTTRDEAKKRFFEILFSKPNDRLSIMFGNASWIEWINDLKSKPFELNPHTNEKNHTNLAWLLQTTEVQVMEKVWQKLANLNIPFLSVHDEIIIKKSDYIQTKNLFKSVLHQEFEWFQLNGKNPNSVVDEGEINSNTSSSNPDGLFSQSKLNPPVSWQKDITELETYFSSILLPTQHIKFDQCSTITNTPRFIESHLSVIKANHGKELFLPYLSRLIELKKILSSSQT